MPTVHYVTAAERHLLDNWRVDRQKGGSLLPPTRHDLASFFEDGQAELFARNLDPSWADVRVEHRDEAAESLHVAHGGKRGADPKR